MKITKRKFLTLIGIVLPALPLLKLLRKTEPRVRVIKGVEGAYISSEFVEKPFGKEYELKRTWINYPYIKGTKQVKYESIELIPKGTKVISEWKA